MPPTTVASPRASLPVTVIIPTRNRALALRRTLESIALQTSQPAQILVIDASLDRSTYESCIAKPVEGLLASPEWIAATVQGAAAQRNQGMVLSRHAVIGFFDDDILLEPHCIARLFLGLQSDAHLGGVNAMITNQLYVPPGPVSRLVFRIMAGRSMRTYAGRVIGPAINLLPENCGSLPELVSVEWLNSTCTMYRRNALPDPPFDRHFTGYSLMEDLALSLRVGRSWKLANVRSARIFHDSQPGTHKSDLRARSCMELVNRHYVMTQILRKTGPRDYAKLCLWEIFQLAAAAKNQRMRAPFWDLLYGKWRATKSILASNRSDQAHGYEDR